MKVLKVFCAGIFLLFVKFVYAQAPVIGQCAGEPVCRDIQQDCTNEYVSARCPIWCTDPESFQSSNIVCHLTGQCEDADCSIIHQADPGSLENCVATCLAMADAMGEGPGGEEGEGWGGGEPEGGDQQAGGGDGGEGEGRQGGGGGGGGGGGQAGGGGQQPGGGNVPLAEDRGVCGDGVCSIDEMSYEVPQNQDLIDPDYSPPSSQVRCPQDCNDDAAIQNGIVRGVEALQRHVERLGEGEARVREETRVALTEGDLDYYKVKADAKKRRDVGNESAGYFGHNRPPERPETDAGRRTSPNKVFSQNDSLTGESQNGETKGDPVDIGTGTFKFDEMLLQRAISVGPPVEVTASYSHRDISTGSALGPGWTLNVESQIRHDLNSEAGSNVLFHQNEGGGMVLFEKVGRWGGFAQRPLTFQSLRDYIAGNCPRQNVALRMYEWRADFYGRGVPLKVEFMVDVLSCSQGYLLFRYVLSDVRGEKRIFERALNIGVAVPIFQTVNPMEDMGGEGLVPYERLIATAERDLTLHPVQEITNGNLPDGLQLLSQGYRSFQEPASGEVHRRIDDEDGEMRIVFDQWQKSYGIFDSMSPAGPSKGRYLSWIFSGVVVAPIIEWKDSTNNSVQVSRRVTWQEHQTVILNIGKRYLWVDSAAVEAFTEDATPYSIEDLLGCFSGDCLSMVPWEKLEAWIHEVWAGWFGGDLNSHSYTASTELYKTSIPKTLEVTIENQNGQRIVLQHHYHYQRVRDLEEPLMAENKFLAPLIRRDNDRTDLFVLRPQPVLTSVTDDLGRETKPVYAYYVGNREQPQWCGPNPNWMNSGYLAFYSGYKHPLDLDAEILATCEQRVPALGVFATEEERNAHRQAVENCANPESEENLAVKMANLELSQLYNPPNALTPESNKQLDCQHVLKTLGPDGSTFYAGPLLFAGVHRLHPDTGHFVERPASEKEPISRYFMYELVQPSGNLMDRLYHYRLIEVGDGLQGEIVAPPPEAGGRPAYERLYIRNNYDERNRVVSHTLADTGTIRYNRLDNVTNQEFYDRKSLFIRGGIGDIFQDGRHAIDAGNDINLVWVSSRGGIDWLYGFDTEGQLIFRTVNPFGNRSSPPLTTSYTYTPADNAHPYVTSRLAATKLPSGIQIQQVFSGRGNNNIPEPFRYYYPDEIVEAGNDGQSSRSTSYIYNSQGSPTSITLPDRRTYTLFYNHAGCVVYHGSPSKVRGPENFEMSTLFGGDGQPRYIVSPLGLVTKLEYGEDVNNRRNLCIPREP